MMHSRYDLCMIDVSLLSMTMPLDIKAYMYIYVYSIFAFSCLMVCIIIL